MSRSPTTSSPCPASSPDDRPYHDAVAVVVADAADVLAQLLRAVFRVEADIGVVDERVASAGEGAIVQEGLEATVQEGEEPIVQEGEGVIVQEGAEAIVQECEEAIG